MHAARIRPLAEHDLDAARALLRDSVPTVSLLESLSSVREAAALAPSDEQRALAADVDGELAAVAVFGEYAGAAGAGRLQLVAVGPPHRRHGIGSLLVERVTSELRARGARFILAELPEERPALDDYFAFLRARGFVEESRIPDFHREGAALVILVRKQIAESRKQ
jgi:GNAT superfamily N-acetyltransferase